MTDRTKSKALRFIVLIGVVSFFADWVYEGARSVTGPYLAILGASGAIAGIMGAYLLRYPQARIQVFWIWIGYRVFWMPAIGMLFYWFGLQVVGQIWVTHMSPHSGGIAYWAHLAGFVTGLVMIRLIPGNAEYSYGTWVKKDATAPLPKAEASTPAVP